MMRQVVATLMVLVLGIVLVLAVSEMPRFGDPQNPSNNVLSNRFTEDILDDVNIPNAITGIIADYRAYDTLGEATVLFAGIAAVLTVLAAHSDVGRGVRRDE